MGFGCVASPKQDTAGENRQAFTVTQNDLSIDKNPADTRWIGVRHVVGRLIGDMLRVEHH
jgi:hypothetical protein